MKPSISVIVPTFNRQNLVRRAVLSVLNQTWRDLELIVVDDASPVPAAEALKGIDDGRLRIIRQDVNRGGPEARNTGITQSRAGLVALLDDDDELLPQNLEKLAAKMAQCPESVGVIHGGIRFCDARGRVIREAVPALRGNIRAHLLRGEKDSNVMGLVRRRCFTDAGLFDPSLASCQDWDLWLRISAVYEFEVVPEILSVYHCHDGQLSNRLQTLIKGRTRMVEKHRDEFAAQPGALAIHLKQLGKLNALAGNWDGAWQWFRAAASLDRREWIKIVAWIGTEYPLLSLRKDPYGP